MGHASFGENAWHFAPFPVMMRASSSSLSSAGPLGIVLDDDNVLTFHGKPLREVRSDCGRRRQ